MELTAGSRHGPIADLVVSGLGAWILVAAGGGQRGAVARIALRVWAPRGVEVFVRPPMPSLPLDYFGITASRSRR